MNSVHKKRVLEMHRVSFSLPLTYLTPSRYLTLDLHYPTVGLHWPSSTSYFSNFNCISHSHCMIECYSSFSYPTVNSLSLTVPYPIIAAPERILTIDWKKKIKEFCRGVLDRVHNVFQALGLATRTFLSSTLLLNSQLS